MILLGHSWGTVLALEYALRHPEHVSQLILMNPAPASTVDLKQFREVYIQELGPDYEQQRQIMATPEYRAGNPETVAMRYRLHFKPALARTGDYEKLMERMKAAFIRQGKDGIVKSAGCRGSADARHVGQGRVRPTAETQCRAGQDAGDIRRSRFLSRNRSPSISLARSRIPTGNADGCGHFAYLECPTEVRERTSIDFLDSPDSRGVDEVRWCARDRFVQKRKLAAECRAAQGKALEQFAIVLLIFQMTVDE
jgi:proline iminopeptidase